MKFSILLLIALVSQILLFTYFKFSIISGFQCFISSIVLWILFFVVDYFYFD